MGDNTRRVLTAVICGASGALVALAGSGAASADPIPPEPPVPTPSLVASAPSTGPAPAAEAAPVSAPVSAAAGEIPQPEGVPHLPSPDAPPPGSTMDPSVQGNEGPNVSYLKDLWHAVQNQEISGKEALIMGLAQRGMNTPYPEQSAGPNVPISPGSNVPMSPGSDVPVSPGSNGPVTPGSAADPALAPPPPAIPLPPTP